MTSRVIVGDCIEVMRDMEAGSVQCVVTSPPYWGLRDYGTAEWEGGDEGCEHKEGSYRQDEGQCTWDGGPCHGGDKFYRSTCKKCGARRIDQQIGLEATPEAYIAKMVEVFREVCRVLRDDGVLALNMGDKRLNKQLLMLPSRLALALQKVGWYVRAKLPWLKRSCMPQSGASDGANVTFKLDKNSERVPCDCGGWCAKCFDGYRLKGCAPDRPTSAIEYVFLLTKSPRYFWDAEAVRVKSRDYGQRNRDDQAAYTEGVMPNGRPHCGLRDADCSSGRNFRNTDLFYGSLKAPHGLICVGDEPVALDVNPEPFKHAHFATFPRKLVTPLIKAATSERGCCPECGAPWKRVVERSKPPAEAFTETSKPDDGCVNTTLLPGGARVGSGQKLQNWLDANPSRTIGWQPGCLCCRKCGIIRASTKGDDYATQRQGERQGVAEGVESQAVGHECRSSGEDEGEKTEARQGVQKVQHQLHGPRGSEVLQQVVCDKVDVGKREGKSIYERCDGEISHSDRGRKNAAATSGGDGKAPGEAVVDDGACPPQERGQGRQSNRKSCGADSCGARENPHKQRFGHDLEPFAPIPCTVLDPFLGAGTTLVVAKQLGLNGVGIELNESYAKMAEQRIANPEPEPEVADVEGQRMLFEET